MALYWVNYDLNKNDKDYKTVIDYLKSHQSWAKPLKSSFLVKTTLTAAQLRDGIKANIDANDSVLVITVTGQSWASVRVPKDVTDWMKEQL
ncbi:hypothetical protein [Dietzia maris]|uniref:hypothetical protein n=1 Tax=Dietzia maris TaxID=37915 RepID=UPI0037C762AB